MQTPFQQPELHASLRYFLESPVSGEVGPMERPEENGYLISANRLDGLNRTVSVLEASSISEGNSFPASFRGDVVTILASMLGSELGKIDLSDEEIVEADRLLFRGGRGYLLGLEVETVPLVSRLLEDRGNELLESSEVAKYVHDFVDQTRSPHLFNNGKTEHLYGEDVASTTSSLGGLMVKHLLRHGPSELLLDRDLELLMEHYEQTGQILLNTNDQFVDSGSPEQGTKAFWLLQLREAEQIPLSQTANPAGDSLVKYYEDGSRRTEIYRNNRAKIIFEASGAVGELGDQRAEEPILSVIAGYERFQDIPYIPAWMRETEIADLPATAMLQVYPDRYVISTDV